MNSAPIIDLLPNETLANHLYWLLRKRASLAMARKSTSAVARLIHLDLAGRYSVLAANSEERFAR